MILLTATTQKLQLTTATADSLDWVCSYVDITTTAFTPGSNQGNVASPTTTDIVAAPGDASTQRQIKQMTFRNRTSNTQTINIVKDVSSTDYFLTPQITLLAGEVAEYMDGRGWRVFNANGIPKLTTVIGAQSSVLFNPAFPGTAALTGVRAITTTNTMAVYVGKAPRALTSASLRLRVTTAMATITWGEVGLAKGSVNVGGNPTLTTVGYADVSASYNSTGQKTTAISVSAGQAINEGDDLWVLIGNQATTALVVRATTMADDIQVGTQASAVMRPSLNIGVGVVFTIDGATTLSPWVALVV